MARNLGLERIGEALDLVMRKNIADSIRTQQQKIVQERINQELAQKQKIADMNYEMEKKKLDEQERYHKDYIAQQKFDTLARLRMKQLEENRLAKERSALDKYREDQYLAAQLNAVTNLKNTNRDQFGNIIDPELDATLTSVQMGLLEKAKPELIPILEAAELRALEKKKNQEAIQSQGIFNAFPPKQKTPLEELEQ